MMSGDPFDALRALPKGSGQIEALYDIFDEAGRLSSQAMGVEFYTTLRMVEEMLEGPSSILDLGAGTGRYSHALAKNGHQLTAVELVKKHAEAILQGKTPEMSLEVRHGDALSVLKTLPDQQFDAVLCLGPLYHLHEEAERIRCLKECARVTKPGGYVYAAFINSDMVIVTMAMGSDRGDYMLTGDYDKKAFRADDFPFKFDTLEEADALVEKAGLIAVCRAAADGMNELCAGPVNSFTQEAYQQWLRFHWHLCKKPHFLGASSHWLYRLRKAPDRSID